MSAIYPSSEQLNVWAAEAREKKRVVEAGDLECAARGIEALEREVSRLRDALGTLSHIHDGNPSDAMADMPPLDYARHMLGEVRRFAREALAE